MTIKKAIFLGLGLYLGVSAIVAIYSINHEKEIEIIDNGIDMDTILENKRRKMEFRKDEYIDVTFCDKETA